MKILVATEKPFAAAAVNGIRNIVEGAGHELALLEKYTEKSQLLAAVADADALIALVRSIMEPRIMAAQADLPPLVTLIAIYVGFRTLGVAGMLLLPIALLFIKQLHDAGFIRLWK